MLVESIWIAINIILIIASSNLLLLRRKSLHPFVLILLLLGIVALSMSIGASLQELGGNDVCRNRIN